MLRKIMYTVSVRGEISRCDGGLWSPIPAAARYCLALGYAQTISPHSSRQIYMYLYSTVLTAHTHTQIHKNNIMQKKEKFMTTPRTTVK